MAKKESTKEYRALVGMDFKDSKGNEHRVEAGDKIEGMPEDERRHLERIGRVEVWRERETENVQDLSSVPVVVHGVVIADEEKKEMDEVGGEE